MTTHHLLTDARDPLSGKLDARRLAGTFGLTLRELGQAIGRDPSGLGKHPTSDTIQAPLHDLEELGVQLRDVFGNLEVARMWLRAPNPVLGGRAPISYVLDRRPVAVQRLLTIAETGMPT